RLLLLLEIRYDAAPGAPLYLLSLHDALPIFFDDCADCAVDALTAQWAARNTPQGETWTGVWDPDAFAALREYVRAELGDALDDVVRQTARILAESHKTAKKLKGTTSMAVLPS